MALNLVWELSSITSLTYPDPFPLFHPGLSILLLLQWQLPKCFALPSLGNQLVPKPRFGHTPNDVFPFQILFGYIQNYHYIGATKAFGSRFWAHSHFVLFNPCVLKGHQRLTHHHSWCFCLNYYKFFMSKCLLGDLSACFPPFPQFFPSIYAAFLGHFSLSPAFPQLFPSFFRPFPELFPSLSPIPPPFQHFHTWLFPLFPGDFQPFAIQSAKAS